MDIRGVNAPLIDVPREIDYLCRIPIATNMNTKPIFDFLLELKNRKQYILPRDFADNHEKARQNYFELLSRMEEEYEACVFQCVAESPVFKEELHIVADMIGDMVYNWKLEIPPHEDSKNVAMQVGEQGLQFLQKYYGVEVKTDTIVKEVKSKKSVGEKSFMNGHEVASFFGIAYNNIKDKQWRDKHAFPYFQPTGSGKVVYEKEEIEEWMRKNGNRC